MVEIFANGVRIQNNEEILHYCSEVFLHALVKFLIEKVKAHLGLAYTATIQKPESF